jgi:hypothetical protein
MIWDLIKKRKINKIKFNIFAASDSCRHHSNSYVYNTLTRKSISTIQTMWNKNPKEVSVVQNIYKNVRHIFHDCSDRLK